MKMSTTKIKNLQKKVRPLENHILRQCLVLLEPENFYRVIPARRRLGHTFPEIVIRNPHGKWQLWRNNTGAVSTASGGFMRVGSPGTGDIIGMAWDGKFIGIECKRDDKEKLKPAQQTFREILEPGGYYFRVDSMEGAFAMQKKLLELYNEWSKLNG